MAREIKFRAWVNRFLPAQSGMFYGLDLYRNTISGGYDRIGVWRNNNRYHFKSEEEPFELMQYTGLKDTKGAEIYDGDILYLSAVDETEHFEADEDMEAFTCISKYYIVVGWHNGCARYEAVKRFATVDDKYEAEWWPDDYGDYDLAGEIKGDVGIVIGNIYENPELLRSQDEH